MNTDRQTDSHRRIPLISGKSFVAESVQDRGSIAFGAIRRLRTTVQTDRPVPRSQSHDSVLGSYKAARRDNGFVSVV